MSQFHCAFFRGRGWREYISFDSVWRPASCPVLSRARGSFALLHRVRSTCIVGSFSSHAKNSPTHMWLRSIHVHFRGMCMHACMPPERWIRRPGGPAKLNHVRCSHNWWTEKVLAGSSKFGSLPYVAVSLMHDALICILPGRRPLRPHSSIKL